MNHATVRIRNRFLSKGHLPLATDLSVELRNPHRPLLDPFKLQQKLARSLLPNEHSQSVTDQGAGTAKWKQSAKYKRKKGSAGRLMQKISQVEAMSDGSEHASQEVEEEEALDAGKNSEDGEGANESGSELTASENEESWVSWFVNLRGHDFFCEVDEDYIQDDFNLTGLGAVVPYYDYALDMMLDVEVSMDSLTEEQQELVESATAVLYGLIHARYILTSRGMQRMVSLSLFFLGCLPASPSPSPHLPPSTPRTVRKVSSHGFWKVSSSLLPRPASFAHRSFGPASELHCQCFLPPVPRNLSP